MRSDVDVERRDNEMLRGLAQRRGILTNDTQKIKEKIAKKDKQERLAMETIYKAMEVDPTYMKTYVKEDQLAWMNFQDKKNFIVD